MNTASITATLTTDAAQKHVIDLEDMTLSDLCDKLRELFPPQNEDDETEDAHADPEDILARVTLSDPEGLAVHLFIPERGTQGQGPLTPIAAFDDVLKAWSDADDDRREAMADYLDNGNDDLDGFEDAYEGKYKDGADFAQEHCEGCGVVTDEFPAWVCIDWEATWERNLSHDYWISDNGHVFRN